MCQGPKKKVRSLEGEKIRKGKQIERRIEKVGS